MDDDDDELEPAWPGIRATLSGKPGIVVVVIVLVVGYFATSLALQQARYHAHDGEPATQTICIPINSAASDPGDAPAGGPTAICVPDNSVASGN